MTSLLFKTRDNKPLDAEFWLIENSPEVEMYTSIFGCVNPNVIPKNPVGIFIDFVFALGSCSSSDKNK